MWKHCLFFAHCSKNKTSQYRNTKHSSATHHQHLTGYKLTVYKQCGLKQNFPYLADVIEMVFISTVSIETKRHLPSPSSAVACLPTWVTYYSLAYIDPTDKRYCLLSLFLCVVRGSLTLSPEILRKFLLRMHVFISYGIWKCCFYFLYPCLL